MSSQVQFETYFSSFHNDFQAIFKIREGNKPRHDIIVTVLTVVVTSRRYIIPEARSCLHLSCSCFVNWPKV